METTDRDDEEAPRFHIDDLTVPASTRSPRNIPKLLRRSLRLTREAAPRELSWSIALQIFAGVAVAAQVLALREVLNHLTSSDPSVGGALGPLLLLTLATAPAQAADGAQRELQRLLGELATRHAVDGVLAVAAEAPLIDFDRPSFHDRVQRAIINASSRPVQMVAGLLSLTAALFATGGIALAVAAIEPILLLLLVLAALPVFLSMNRSSRLLYRFSLEQTHADRRRGYISAVLSRRQEAAELRAFDLSGFFREEWRRLYEERFVALRQLVRTRLKLAVLASSVNAVLRAGVLWAIVWAVSTGRFELAEAGAAAAAVVLLGGRLQQAASGASSLYESALFLADYTDFIEAAPARRPRDGVAEMSAAAASVSADGVWFRYPASQVPAIRGVDLTIKVGEVVALVGENGSGKTTLAKLLAGLYQPDEGEVRWEAEDGSEQPAPLVGVVFQDHIHYLLSARENIAVGDVDALNDDARLLDASERGGAHEFLGTLPQGYETLLGPEFVGGSDLSGGQWQRVALARALFRDAPLVILDEPSAALDARAEADLFARMRELCRGRTVLLISHRFGSVRTVDRIYVLHEGEVIENGTHAELMRQQGLYAELFNMQASAYADDEDGAAT